MDSSWANDPSAFRSFEHAGWQKVSKQYHESFASLTSQAIGPLLDAVTTGKGTRLLDVATGPGYVAAAASQRGASVMGVDFSAAMVADANRQYPNIQFREGDAEALPFPDGSFDAVVMNFGLLHLGNPEQAFMEAHRVLGTSGRFAFTVWCKPDVAVGFGIVLDAVQARGQLNVPLPPGPPFFRFSDPGECVQALLKAGFAMPEVVQVPQIWRLPSPDALFNAMQSATVRTAGILRAQLPEALEAIGRSIREATATYQRGEGIELPMPAVLASAQKM
jgi:ubiquinone/menaquinone biosynthesis C-methylase UbiE